MWIIRTGVEEIKLAPSYYFVFFRSNSSWQGIVTENCVGRKQSKVKMEKRCIVLSM
jgi:hypothetical protein